MIATCRAETICQRSRSQRSAARIPASRASARTPGRSFLVAERSEDSLRHRRRGRVAVGETHRKGIQQPVGLRAALRGGGAPRAAAPTSRSPGPRREMAGEDRRREALPNRFRGPARTSSCSSRRAAASSSGVALSPRSLRERDLAHQQVGPCVPELIGRPGLCDRQQSGRRLERTGLELGLCSFQGALRAAGGILGQRCRALEERGHRRNAATSLGPPRPNAPVPRRRLRRGLARPAQRCQARRSGSTSASIDSASARCASCRSGSDAAR